MLKITDDQERLLLEYLPDTKHYIENDDIDQLLEDLDDKITEIGFDAEYELNAAGLKLQQLYDQLCDKIWGRVE